MLCGGRAERLQACKGLFQCANCSEADRMEVSALKNEQTALIAKRETDIPIPKTMYTVKQVGRFSALLCPQSHSNPSHDGKLHTIKNQA